MTDEKTRQANRERQRKYREAHRDEINQQRKERYNNRIANGKCPRCGGKVKKGYTLCTDCCEYQASLNRKYAKAKGKTETKTASKTTSKTSAVKTSEKKPAAKTASAKKTAAKTTTTKKTAAKTSAAKKTTAKTTAAKAKTATQKKTKTKK